MVTSVGGRNLFRMQRAVIPCTFALTILFWWIIYTVSPISNFVLIVTSIVNLQIEKAILARNLQKQPFELIIFHLNHDHLFLLRFRKVPQPPQTQYEDKGE